MKDPKYLSPLGNHLSFFDTVKKGNIIEYSISYSRKDAIKICKEFGFTVKYCEAESREHKLFGCTCLKVIGEYSSNEPVKLQYFNPEELVL